MRLLSLSLCCSPEGNKSHYNFLSRLLSAEGREEEGEEDSGLFVTFASLSFPSFLLRFVAAPPSSSLYYFFSRAHLRESKVRTSDPKIILLAASGETFPLSLSTQITAPLLAKNSGKEEEEIPIRLSPSFPERQRVLFFCFFIASSTRRKIVNYSWAWRETD